MYISVYPLRDRGYDVIPFDTDDLEGTLLNKNLSKDNDIIIGCVESTTTFYEAMGIKVPSYLGYPSSLNEYLHREIYVKNFSDLWTYDYPFFVKPYNDVKLFTGELIENLKQLNSLQEWNEFDNDLQVFVSQPTNFLSEYRVFVHKGEVRGVKYYKGSFDYYIDMDIVCNMIEDFKNSPIAYTLDVGYTDEGETALVEVNDMWAIGSYGMKGVEYVRMVVDRHFEIVRSS